MKSRETELNGIKVAVIEPEPGEKLITDVQSALDLAMTVKYENQTNCIAVPKEAIADNFFILSSGIAGEILQKYINYQVRLAIFGDFSGYTSKPLQDLIRESNKGADVYFVRTEREAVECLAGVK